MSSSDPVRRFFRGFGTTLAVFLGGLLAAMAIIDPQGAGPGNALCPAGSKIHQVQSFKSLIAWKTAPRTAILGTSRIKIGFDSTALGMLGPKPSVNLGQGGGQPGDFRVLAQDALAGGRLERAYVGIDFNMVHGPKGEPPERPISTFRWPRAEAWRRNWLDLDAARQLHLALPECTALFDQGGALIRGEDGKLDMRFKPFLDPAPFIARVAETRESETDRARRSAGREAELEAMLGELQQRGVVTVLFIPPVRGEFSLVLARAGLTGEQVAWRNRMAALAARRNVSLINFQEPAEFAALKMPPCPNGGNGCHFFDLTHFDMPVARAMAKRLGAVK